MTTHVDVVTRHGRRSAAVRGVRRAVRVGRWGPVALTALLLVVALAVTYGLLRWPGWVPWASYVPIVVVAGLFLRPHWVAVVDGATALCVLWAIVSIPTRGIAVYATALVLVIVACFMGWLALSRARLGVQGTLGESMLVDLRDRLRAHGELPDLPEPWHAETSLHSAYGESFSGDFIVTARSDDGNRMEVALVDVSGKGVGAGTRALLLSGAFGGLLGAMPPWEFLPAANAYLLRQEWTEGFATAIHLAVDLDSGDFSLGAAGHPPGVKFSAGSGRWSLLDSEAGPVLGVLEGSAFPRVHGRLDRGDAMLLYTDGVIETRTRDLSVGIDRMLGAAERLVSRGFSGGASRISSVALAGETDDRAVVLVWRS